MITKLAYKALIKEVELTPKPGLVDKANSGSHSDMDIYTFYASAKVIEPFISEFVTCGANFELLRKVGLKCEKEMFKATKGVNTHKGMIFSLAVICGALGSLNKPTPKSLHNKIKEICKGIVQKDLQNLSSATTYGEKFYKETKHGGIREEAQSGYPLVFDVALPFYKSELLKSKEDIALKRTLLVLMSQNNDSNLFARGGVKGLEFVQRESKKILLIKDTKEFDKKLQEFDRILIEKNLSAGGSADLLGITWFLSELI